MRDVGDLLADYMDFLEILSKEVERNLNYEFNEFHKERLRDRTLHRSAKRDEL